MLNSKFTDVEGHRVHYWEGGSGRPVLMVHGVGPGTSSVGNFGPVLEPLAQRFHVFAIDLIGFGASGRKRDKPYFDASLWLRQCAAMLELVPQGPWAVAGHSFGGVLALRLAARSSRVTKVLTSSSIGAPYALNEALDGFWSTTAGRDELRRAMQRMVFDPSAITDQMIDDRAAFLSKDGYADYVKELFAPPRQRYIDAGVIAPDELARIGADVVMLHGRQDLPCPVETTSLAVARSLPRADLQLLGRCGHNLPRERSAEYVVAVTNLLSEQA